MTEPAKTGHVGTDFCLLFQTSITHNTLYHHAMEMQFSALSKHLVAFMMQLQVTDFKYSVPVVRYDL